MSSAPFGSERRIYSEQRGCQRARTKSTTNDGEFRDPRVPAGNSAAAGICSMWTCRNLHVAALRVCVAHRHVLHLDSQQLLLTRTSMQPLPGHARKPESQERGTQLALKAAGRAAGGAYAQRPIHPGARRSDSARNVGRWPIPSGQAVRGGGEPRAIFLQQVDAYVALHRRLEAGLPPQVVTGDLEQLFAPTRSLGKEIRAREQTRGRETCSTRPWPTTSRSSSPRRCGAAGSWISSPSSRTRTR